jgi:hypothetical protein
MNITTTNLMPRLALPRRAPMVSGLARKWVRLTRGFHHGTEHRNITQALSTGE